jgi:DNA-binding LacI/PurR family transcriptional regulator
VAVSTVSRALSNGPRVSEATRKRITAIADEMGYRPSRFARSMRSAHTQTIGFVAPDLENPVVNDYLRATVRAAHERGYTLFVADGQSSSDIQDAAIRRLLEYRVDGFLIGRGMLPVSDMLIELIRRGLPTEPDPWTIEDLLEARGEITTAYPERAQLEQSAAIIAYRALLEAGHTRIAYVTRTLSPSYQGVLRREALHEVLAEAGRGAADLHVVRTEPPDCLAEMQELTARSDRPTAIVCANGLLTPYVLEGIHSAGLQIPRDLSFLCFGDSAWHRGYSPPLSVIRHDYAAAANRSVERLIARIEGRDIPEISRRPS